MSSSFGKFVVRVLAVCTFLMVLGLSIHAQSTLFGAIGGAVLDQQDKAIPGATVTVRNLGTNASTKPEKTDSNGRYRVTNLAPGSYEVTISAPNFADYKQTEVIVEIGLTTAIDVKMGLAGQTEKVAVSGEAPVINTEQNTFSANVNKLSIDNLPLNIRRWSVFALGTPSAVADGTFGDVSFRGISGLLNNNTVDGGDNNQAYFAEEKGRTRIAYSTSANAIQEFQVNDANYSAEYGRAAGGVVNAVTKSGTNTIHGSVYEYMRDNSWAAFNPFATAATQTSPGVFQILPIKPSDVRHQFGGDAGGYVFKNKLFWYFNFDEQHRVFPGVAIPTNPTFFFSSIPVAAPAGGCTLSQLKPGSSTSTTAIEGNVLYCRMIAANPALTLGQMQTNVNGALNFLDSLTGTTARNGVQTIFFPKVDWKPTDNNTVTLSYNRLRWRSPFGIQTSAVVSRGIDSWGDDFVKGESAQARWSSVIGTSMTNEARFLFSRDFEFEFTDPPAPGEPVSASTGLSPQIDIGGSSIFNFGAPDFLQRAALPDEHRYQFADTFGWNHGKHFIKFGFDINYVTDRISNLFQSLGEYNYLNRDDFISDYMGKVDSLGGGTICSTQLASGNSPIPCYSGNSPFQQGFGPLGLTFNTWDLGFFAQDDYHITRRLTLTLGLRWEKEIFPTPVAPNPAISQTGTFPSDNKDFGPRVGFAWDVLGDGKTVVRGGFGLYYGRIINGNIFNALEDTGLSSAQLSTTVFPVNSATGIATPGVPLYPNILAGATPAASKNVVFFAPDARLPQIDQFDLTVEHEISANTAVSISYIGSIGRFLPLAQDTNFNTPVNATFTIAGQPVINFLPGPALPAAGATFTIPVYIGPRPNPSFNQMTQISTVVRSYYHAAALQFNRRLVHGLQVQAGYTFSKALDDDQVSSATLSGNTPLSPANIKGDYSPSNFDIRHKFGVSAIWQPENFAKSDNRGARYLLSGWTISPIISASTGGPLSAAVSGSLPSAPGSFTTGPTSGGVIGISGSSRVPFFGRNSFRMPAYFDTDFRLARDFHIGERFVLQGSVDFFNLFNNVNITSVGSTLFTSISGTASNPVLNYPATSTFSLNSNGNNGTFAPTPRQIQFGARFSF
ncbi:MAG TPA: TonB-dependent receptor [Candidatus Acidoferrales bacterium]|nr:TonB-dependent receptor [Candidatus Acidoferrales bacterium]